MSDNNGTNSPDDKATTRGSRKRKRNEKDWKVNQRKLARQEGREYMTRKGVMVPRKTVGPACTCKRKCMDLLSDQDKVEIMSRLYTGKPKNEQDTFLQGLMEARSIKRHRKRIAESANCRSSSFDYFIM
ncbi:unnamed protein product, partial [Callosobruchus maculatus]